MQYFEPNFLDEALVLLDRFAPHSFVLAGGTILAPRLRDGATAATIVNVKRVRELHEIEVLSPGVLRIGALVTARELCESDLVLAHAPLLATAAATLGAPALRNVATIGGNLCSGISSADLSVALLACEARCVIAGEAAGPITISLDEFFADRSTTDRSTTTRRLLTAIEVPACSASTAYQKMQTRQAFEIAIVGVAVAMELGSGAIARVRIALGGVASRPIRASHAEHYLEGNPFSMERAQQAALIASRDDANPRTDHRASAEYRRHLVAVFAQRALQQAVESREEAAR